MPFSAYRAKIVNKYPEHTTVRTERTSLHPGDNFSSGTCPPLPYRRSPGSETDKGDAVRRAVDRHAPAGRFLATGSAAPRADSNTHSGAGRIISLRMRPMSLFERGDFTATVRFNDVISGNNPRISETSAATLPDYTAAIADSGFPGILSLPERRRSQALDNYLRQVVDRDLPGAGYTARRPETLRRWLAAYGAASSTPTSYSRILDATTGRDGSQPSKDTTAHYRDLLSPIWVLDPVPAWNPVRNPLKAAQLAPKHQLVDPALALRLQGLSARDLTLPRGSHLLGVLFEPLATLSTSCGSATSSPTTSSTSLFSTRASTPTAARTVSPSFPSPCSAADATEVSRAPPAECEHCEAPSFQNDEMAQSIA